jgi:hypothetical protein
VIRKKKTDAELLGNIEPYRLLEDEDEYNPENVLDQIETALRNDFDAIAKTQQQVQTFLGWYLANPYYDLELREKTGNDKEIQDYVMNCKEGPEYLEKFIDLITFLIPNYIKEGKNQLVISIGCTGGKHRSVSFVNRLFDFYAGTVKRAPMWWQQNSLEWCYRLLKEPRRMWKRYIIGNLLFIWNMCKECRHSL